MSKFIISVFAFLKGAKIKQEQNYYPAELSELSMYCSKVKETFYQIMIWGKLLKVLNQINLARGSTEVLLFSASHNHGLGTIYWLQPLNSNSQSSEFYSLFFGSHVGLVFTHLLIFFTILIYYYLHYRGFVNSCTILWIIFIGPTVAFKSDTFSSWTFQQGGKWCQLF